jgi:hypothetical protein
MKKRKMERWLTYLTVGVMLCLTWIGLYVLYHAFIP